MDKRTDKYHESREVKDINDATRFTSILPLKRLKQNAKVRTSGFHSNISVFNNINSSHTMATTDKIQNATRVSNLSFTSLFE